MKKIVLVLLIVPVFSMAQINDTIRTLFLGNSYTGVNNLPKMVADVAKSMDDTLIYEAYTPGGKQLSQHINDISTLSYIRQGVWDRVVLQEQSQKPSFPDTQVESDVYPFAAQLNDTIKKYNPCAETVFYMTWGRENGDAGNCPFWPPVCTYEGMDDLLRERYETMATDNDAEISPVGAVWRYIRDNSLGVDLYSPDESHPSLEGTYAAACTFYTVFFEKDPTLITFNPGISTADEASIKNAVKTIVYDDLAQWNIGKYVPQYDFTSTKVSSTQYEFTSISTYVDEYLWDFGDGNTSTLENPTHTYSSNDLYTITLTSGICDEGANTASDMLEILDVESLEFQHNLLYPNPIEKAQHINVNSNISFSTFNLYSLEGKLIRFGKIVNTTIETSSLESGTYIMVLSSTSTKESAQQLITIK